MVATHPSGNRDGPHLGSSLGRCGLGAEREGDSAVREAAGADRVATDCPLAALQIKQGTGVEARHPIRILAEAYGIEDS